MKLRMTAAALSLCFTAASVAAQDAAANAAAEVTGSAETSESATGTQETVESTTDASADADLQSEVTSDAASASTNADAETDINEQSGQIDLRSGTNANAGLEASSDEGFNADVNSEINANNRLGDSSSQVGADSAFGATLNSNESGLVVNETMSGSTAASFGLQPGDRIIGFDGQVYRDSQSFLNAVGQYNSNRQPELIFERNGRIYSKTATMLNSRQRNSSGTWSANRPTYQSSTANRRSGGSTQFHRSGHTVSTPIYSYGPACGTVVHGTTYRNQVYYPRYSRNGSFYAWDYDDQEWEEYDADDWDDYVRDQRRERRRYWDDRFDD